MRENAGEISLCGNVREKRAKYGSLPPNAGGLATMLGWGTNYAFLSFFPQEDLKTIVTFH